MPTVAVLYTSNEVASEAIVLISVVEVKLIRVIKIPFLLAAKSSIVDGFWANTGSLKLKIIKQPRPQIDDK